MNYLSKNGYVLRKENLTNDEILKLKNELIAKPLSDMKYNFNQSFDFPIYIETKNKFYIPKMYGISKFGDPNKYLDNYTGKQW